MKFRQINLILRKTNYIYYFILCQIMVYRFILPVESKTRTHYGPVGSGRRTAGQRGGAGQGRTGRRWVDPARG